MGNNYAIGHRDMATAGRLVLGTWFRGADGSIAEIGFRWGLFCAWAGERHGVKKMEKVTFDLVVQYGRLLQSELEAGLRASSSAAKCYVSAVNTVMNLATAGEWKHVRPGKDCGISTRKYIATFNKAMGAAKHETVKNLVTEKVSALLGLQREFGLRFKESCLLDAKRAIKDVQKNGHIVLRAGTKGGRRRTVPCRSGGMAVLERATAVQDGRTMVPDGMSYKEFRRQCYEQARIAKIRFHSERHAYAQQRYTEITGAPAPVHAGWPRKTRIANLAGYLGVSEEEAKAVDAAARLQISIELGHNRSQISDAYLG